MTLDEFIDQECNRDQSSWFHKDEIKRLIGKWEKLKLTNNRVSGLAKDNESGIELLEATTHEAVKPSKK